MGCCFSCFEDRSSQLGDPSERTTLLGNPVSNNLNRPNFNDDYGTQNTSPYGQRGDEQSALSRILHQTASDIIDVSAMDSQLEQHEYHDRARAYQQRVAGNATAVRKSSYGSRGPCLLADLPAPDRILSEEPISAEDRKMMEDSFAKVKAAIEGLQVTHKEELVVQFGIP